MGKKKRYRGHYCKVCACILPNEKFSGKGHAKHICKECSKLTEEEQKEEIALNKIYRLCGYMNLSKVNRKMLEAYLESSSAKIRLAAQKVLSAFSENFEWEEMMEPEVFYQEPDEWDFFAQKDALADDDLPF